MQKNKKLKVSIITGAFILCAYFALSPIVLSNVLLYLPKTVVKYSSIPSEVFGTRCEAVEFASANGKLLSGIYVEKKESKYTVLLHHGQGGNLETHFGLAKMILLADCSVLIYDYQGFGMSEGKASNRNMLDDGDAAYNFLIEQKHLEASSIINCGISLGSGVACHVAEKHPCAAVVLISPYLSINQVAIERIPHFRFYPRMLFPQPDMGSLKFIKSNERIPVLIIHGANDTLVSVRNALELNKLAKAPHLLVIDKNAHHGDFSTIFLSDQIKLFVKRSCGRISR